MLIKQDTPVTNQGRDIGTSLANLCKQIAKKDMQMAITIFQTNLDRHYLNEVSRLEKKAMNTRVNPSQFEMLQDRNNCIEAVMQGLQTVGELVDRLKNLFSDCDKTGQPKEKVLLSSVHRAKGLEAESVFILEPEKMPHPMAQLEWELSQEYNIKYVALTRSLDKLTFVMEGEL
jgi:superfamily I DNA/RNA helicase